MYFNTSDFLSTLGSLMVSLFAKDWLAYFSLAPNGSGPLLGRRSGRLRRRPKRLYRGQSDDPDSADLRRYKRDTVTAEQFQVGIEIMGRCTPVPRGRAH